MKLKDEIILIIIHAIIPLLIFFVCLFAAALWVDGWFSKEDKFTKTITIEK